MSMGYMDRLEHRLEIKREKFESELRLLEEIKYEYRVIYELIECEDEDLSNTIVLLRNNYNKQLELVDVIGDELNTLEENLEEVKGLQRES